MQENYPEGRTIVCCFDGGGQKFGDNTNVVKFFRALRKDLPSRQIVYYQPEAGTYRKYLPIPAVFSTLFCALDSAVAINLNQRLKDGYKFIVQSHRKGDKICLFGFSSGAHIARALASMIYKVGIIPPENLAQIDFAFSISQMEGETGNVLCKEFRASFSKPAIVEFLGIWDTTSSVGTFIPRNHNNLSINYAVNFVRHALALDERRSGYRPALWDEPYQDNELDNDVDEPPSWNREDRDGWVFEPQERYLADVQEVWFTGCHDDIGGGSHTDKIKESLSYIPLRWMIKECFAIATGIVFNNDYLVTLGLDPSVLEELAAGGPDIPEAEVDQAQHPLRDPDLDLDPEETIVTAKPPRDKTDSLAGIWDPLDLVRAWWILEYIPTLSVFQDDEFEFNGNWWFKRRQNRGRGRYIPFRKEDGYVLVHESVKDRIERTNENLNVLSIRTEDRYEPRALNWRVVVESGAVLYVP
ncbi:hypothetical protein BDN72DRAFT_775750 [Pluteus cervinus]|uniref:Uncharacterized protein n=1 Tax=Pluteus cervinus TaxID=181527 RepID=A0ACD3AD24_9AGAR|nr:hypothetical protein BDN72DRAFT_775750 [Pluteus cervinus]